MNTMTALGDVVAAGFLLIRPVPRPAWMSAELLPDQIVSASRCICPQFPGSYAISWCAESADARRSDFGTVGLAPDRREEATTWATDNFQKSFGWPGVFYNLDAATEARQRFFHNSGLRIIGIGLPERYREAFIRDATPPPTQPGFASYGASGYFDVVGRNAVLPPGATVLGFEPVSVEDGGLAHSWLCNGLERYVAENRGIRPGPTGLIPSFSEAVICCEAIGQPEVGAEPGPWFPWLLVRYDDTVIATKTRN